jgi:large subunit ribosomal protein L29
MKTEELRELDAEELGGRLKGARRELYELRFKLAVGQLDNHREIRNARKEIARILTVVHQRRLEAVDGEPFISQSDDDRRGLATEAGSEDQAAEAEGDAQAAGTPAPVEVEAEEVETAETATSAGPVAGERGVSEGAADEADDEGGRAKRRRSRKAGNEDEG